MGLTETKAMKPDDFEHRLRQTPLNPPPTAWRGEILANARAARAPETEPTAATQRTPRLGLADLALLWQWLRGALWPRPVAWAVLLLLWLPMGAVELALRESGDTAHPPDAVTFTPAQVQTLASARRQMLSELLAPPPSPRPKIEPADRPRSDIPLPHSPDSAQNGRLSVARLS